MRILPKVGNYFKRKKLQDEISKVEKNIERQQDKLHTDMEYLSVLQRDLRDANYKRRRKR